MKRHMISGWKVILKAVGIRRVAMNMRRELGEWGAKNRAADPMLRAPNRPKPSSPVSQPEGGYAVTIAQLYPLSHLRNAVQFTTRTGCA